MATVEREGAVSVGDDRLLVRNLEVLDPEVVSYFGSLPESEQLDRRLEQALRIGVLAVTSTGASQNVNYVETAFEAMKSEFGRKMDEVFDERGPLSDVIARHFGEDGTVIREQFNPGQGGQPAVRAQGVPGQDARRDQGTRSTRARRPGKRPQGARKRAASSRSSARRA